MSKSASQELQKDQNPDILDGKPEWVANLLLRLMGLDSGRYMAIITKTKAGVDWTLTDLGKVER